MRSALQQRIFLALLVIALLCAVFIRQSKSESSTDAWLRYAPIESAATRRQSVDKVVMVGDSIVLKTAQEELIHGIREMVGVTLTSSDEPTPGSIVLGTFEELRRSLPLVISRHYEAGRLLDHPGKGSRGGGLPRNHCGKRPRGFVRSVLPSQRGCSPARIASQLMSSSSPILP